MAAGEVMEDGKRRVLGAVLVVALVVWGPPVPAGAAVRVTRSDESVSIEAQTAPLKDVLAAIATECRVRITGLEGRGNEAVSFVEAGDSLENAIKRLLRYLNVDNYVFLYTRTRLKAVSVVLSTGPRAVASGDTPGGPPPPEATGMISAVRVLRAAPGTQAENLDIRAGDLVAEYDGVRVTESQQLVELVKAKPPEDVVEMVVIRELRPVRLTLNGGVIGINIATIQIPADQMGPAYAR